MNRETMITTLSTIINKFGERIFSADGKIKIFNGKLYRFNYKEMCLTVKDIIKEGDLWLRGDKKIVAYKGSEAYDILDSLNKEEAVIVFRLLSKEKAGMAFSYMETDMREKLIQNLTDAELKNVLDELFMDDTVDLIEEMPSNVVTRILQSVNRNDRKIINELLKYPDDSAGSMMTVEYVNIKKDMTVGEAIARVRRMAQNSETIYTVYVTENRKLIGICTVKELLISKDEEKIENIMETNIITISTGDDQEDVAKMFSKYGFLAFPVVDHEERLVGIVTVDDAMDVLQEENTEDFEIMAAITPSEDSYFKTSVFKHAKNRILWLLLLMLSAAITGGILTWQTTHYIA